MFSTCEHVRYSTNDSSSLNSNDVKKLFSAKSDWLSLRFFPNKMTFFVATLNCWSWNVKNEEKKPSKHRMILHSSESQVSMSCPVVPNERKTNPGSFSNKINFDVNFKVFVSKSRWKMMTHFEWNFSQKQMNYKEEYETKAELYMCPHSVRIRSQKSSSESCERCVCLLPLNGSNTVQWIIGLNMIIDEKKWDSINEVIFRSTINFFVDAT